MPLYEYECPNGHVHELLRKRPRADEIATCPECQGDAKRIISAHHQAVDGIYSYAPNIGDPDVYERRKADADARADRTGTYKP